MKKSLHIPLRWLTEGAQNDKLREVMVNSEYTKKCSPLQLFNCNVSVFNWRNYVDFQVNVVLQEIDRSKLNLLEKLGEGQFGEIHLCQINPDTPGLPSDLNTHLVAVKSLRKDCDEASR